MSGRSSSSAMRSPARCSSPTLANVGSGAACGGIRTPAGRSQTRATSISTTWCPSATPTRRAATPGTRAGANSMRTTCATAGISWSSTARPIGPRVTEPGPVEAREPRVLVPVRAVVGDGQDAVPARDHRARAGGPPGDAGGVLDGGQPAPRQTRGEDPQARRARTENGF